MAINTKNKQINEPIWIFIAIRFHTYNIKWLIIAIVVNIGGKLKFKEELSSSLKILEKNKSSFVSLRIFKDSAFLPISDRLDLGKSRAVWIV